MSVRSSGPSVSRASGALGAFLVVSLLLGVLVAGLAIPAVGAVGTAANQGLDFFDSLPTSLEERPLAQQSTILAANGDKLATFYAENRVEVPLSKVSETMQKSIIAIEDSRFYEHGGVDVQGLLRAAVHNSQSATTQGASTLAQQYVKNVLVENAVATGNKAAQKAAVATTLSRKLREAKLAIALEKKYTKKQILERYLNIALFGGNLYGIESAAWHYFGVHAADLNLPQSALLAGLVQNPNGYDPETNPDRALRRRNVVLDRMLQLKVITQAEHDDAVKTGLGLNPQQTPYGCAAAGDAAFFCDYVSNVIQHDQAFGKTAEARANLLNRGGLTIRTTLDPNLQHQATQTLMATIPADDPSHVGTALSTVEPGTGRILAMAQNRVYNATQNVKPGETSVNFNSDKTNGGSSGFQVGSTWKVFVLAQWLKSGHSLNETISATPKAFAPSSWNINPCYGRYTSVYSPHNAGDSENRPNETVMWATQQSVNLAYANMANQLNLCDIADTAQSLGVHRADGGKLDPRPGAMVLGANEIAPLTMAAAYATFASGGTYCAPIAIDSVTDSTGKKYDVPKADCHQALDPKVTSGVTAALQATFQGGTTKGLDIGVPAGAKTGTTDIVVGSSWLSGFTSSLATSVWVGPTNGAYSISNRRIGGQYYGSIYGATIAGKEWQAYMRQAVQGRQNNPFPPADPTVLNGPQTGVPQVAGQSVQAAVAALTGAGFKTQVMSGQVASPVPAGQVAYTSPGGGSQASSGSTVRIYVSSGPAPAAQPTPVTPGNGGPAQANNAPANGQANGQPNQGNGQGNGGNGN